MDLFESEDMGDGYDQYGDLDAFSSGESTLDPYDRPSIKQTLAQLDKPPTAAVVNCSPQTVSKVSGYVPRKGGGRRWTTAKV